MGISSETAIPSSKLGTYHETDITRMALNAHRPIYQKGDEYLFYWSASQFWLIGPDYSQFQGNIISAKDAAALCPNLAAEWMAWDGSAFSSVYGITVTAIYQAEACKIYLTTSGGSDSHRNEKWVSITTGSDATGTLKWGQGGGTLENKLGAGLLTDQEIALASG